jgi:hypothetical protein
MSNENTEMKFFTRHQSANAIFDVEQIAAPNKIKLQIKNTAV